MQNKKTVVLGASTNPSRYSNIATKRLMQHNMDVVPVGIRIGAINGKEIQQGTPNIEDVDTVTLYLNPQRQKAYYDYILGLKPKRIIYNPGTENAELMQLAKEQGIQNQAGCTLVMLSIGNY